MPPSRVRLALGLCLVAGVLTACGGEHRPSEAHRAGEQAAAPRLAFGYDRSRPLGYLDRGVIARLASIAVHDVAYSSNDKQVAGYLFEDERLHHGPAVVLVHGSGGDRRELFDVALALAHRGVVALTITEPSASQAQTPPASPQALLARTQAGTVIDVIAIRRAADVLSSLPTVDSRRVGYLGWSAGAKTGAFVAASDRRFKALALLSAGAAKLAEFVAAAPPSLRPLVRRQLGSVDPLRYLAWAAPGTVLLEDGRRDEVVPHQALLNMIHAAPPRTLVRWYQAPHELNSAAFRDALTWLVHKLAGNKGH